MHEIVLDMRRKTICTKIDGFLFSTMEYLLPDASWMVIFSSGMSCQSQNRTDPNSGSLNTYCLHQHHFVEVFAARTVDSKSQLLISKLVHIKVM